MRKQRHANERGDDGLGRWGPVRQRPNRTLASGHTAPGRGLDQQAAVCLKQRDTGSGSDAVSREATGGGGNFRVGKESGKWRARRSGGGLPCGRPLFDGGGRPVGKSRVHRAWRALLHRRAGALRAAAAVIRLVIGGRKRPGDRRTGAGNREEQGGETAEHDEVDGKEESAEGKRLFRKSP